MLSCKQVVSTQLVSAVGKTSVVHLVTRHQVLAAPQSTVGADVDVMMHVCGKSAYWIEFVEVGGSPAFELSRPMWYKTPFDAILGVYDVCNINSRNNLDLWFREALRLQRVDALPWTTGEAQLKLDLTRHPDRQLAGRILPVLIVANKMDVLLDRGLSLAPESRQDFLMSATVGYGILGNGSDDRKETIRQFLDAAIAHQLNQPNSASPQSAPPTPVKLGLGALSPFASDRSNKKKRQGHDTSEVRLRIDFDD